MKKKETQLATIAAASPKPPLADWIDATEHDPVHQGYYNVKASSLSTRISQLFWDKKKKLWLYREGGKHGFDIRLARQAEWQGLAGPSS